MSENKAKFDLEKIIEKDSEHKRKKQKGKKVITLRDYIDLLKNDPLLSQNSASRLLEIFYSYGVEEISEEDHIFGATRRFPLISGRLFGHAADKATEDFVTWLEAASKNLKPTSNMGVVFVGPTAGGKTTFVDTIISALEKYNERKVYKIKDCPMHHDPLLVLPRYMRRDPRYWNSEKAKEMGLSRPIEDELGISDIQGDLCPNCRSNFLGWEDTSGEHHQGKYVDDDGVFRWWDIEIETFNFSLQAGRGIGSFEPSDEKSQDVTDLTGKENQAITKNPKAGYEHPKAFSLTGELEKASRGIMEMREIFKKGIDERILWVFINVNDKNEIKVQGSNLPHLYVDVVTIGHCNLVGFKEFESDSGQEALHSRFYIILFKYPLRVKEEIRIYEKLIKEESDLKNLDASNGYHICPGSLELAASFAILTRLKESNMGIDILSKLKAYNGDSVLTDLEDDENNPVSLENLLEEGGENDDISKREGMFGLDARNILSALNTEIVKQPNGGCLTPLNTIRSLRGMFEHIMGHSPEAQKNYLNLLSAEEGGSVISLYKEWAVEKVGQAFLGAYEDLAHEIFNKYMEEIEYDRSRKRKMVPGTSLVKKDQLTGKVKEPNERLMRSVEVHIGAMGIHKDSADVFRGEIIEYRSTNNNFGYETYEPLRRAVQQKLLQDARSSLTLVLSTDKPHSEEDSKRAKDLFDSMKEEGFCEIGARETIEMAAEILNE